MSWVRQPLAPELRGPEKAAASVGQSGGGAASGPGWPKPVRTTCSLSLRPGGPPSRGRPYHSGSRSCFQYTASCVPQRVSAQWDPAPSSSLFSVPSPQRRTVPGAAGSWDVLAPSWAVPSFLTMGLRQPCLPKTGPSDCPFRTAGLSPTPSFRLPGLLSEPREEGEEGECFPSPRLSLCDLPAFGLRTVQHLSPIPQESTELPQFI